MANATYSNKIKLKFDEKLSDGDDKVRDNFSSVLGTRPPLAQTKQKVWSSPKRINSWWYTILLLKIGNRARTIPTLTSLITNNFI